MKKLGFFLKKIDLKLYPTSPNDLESNWLVIAPSLSDSLDCVEIDNKYLLSIGAHASHTILLFSKNENLNYLNAVKISNILSYLLDTVIHVGVPDNKDAIKKHYKGLTSYFKLKGITFNDEFSLERKMAEKYEIIDDIVGDFHSRVITNKQFIGNKSFGLDLPKSDKIERAIMAYKQGILSFEPYGQILNYWRVLEAITSIKERCKLFENFYSIRLNPVYAYDSYSNREIINLIPTYKKYIKPYYKKLIYIHGNSNNLSNFFYKNRRCSTAHNKHDSLQETDNVTLASLYKDAFLLKIIARCAIEKSWRKLYK